MLIKRLSIIGVGLIGGSLARDLKRAGQCATVIGCGRSLDNLEKARELGVVDNYTQDIGQAVSQADMVVLAVPLGAMPEVFRQMRETLPAQAIVTDAGSSKAAVVEAARENLGEALSRFVPGHPIAGAEQSGVEASREGLFEQRRVILTPLSETKLAAHAKVKAMWKSVGAEVVDMGVDQHDRVLAATSHLPHILAFALVDLLAGKAPEDKVFEYAAGGFKDFSRIASSDPHMWRDICLANERALLNLLQEYQAKLGVLEQLIRAKDGEALEALFKHAKTARDKVYSA